MRVAGTRAWAWAALSGVLALGLGLRLWGIAQGLPYVYNLDESDHFLPRAVAMFRDGLNPHYFANPPAYTYLLHVALALWIGGATAVAHTYAHDPREVYVLARVCAALLGTIALWELYIVGSRLLGRAAGLIAAAIEAVAFLPVYYSHLALNDVPTLAPLTLSLIGSAGILRRGRGRDHLIAGVGLGLACATKYTAGIVLVPLLAAALAPRAGQGDAWGPAAGLAVALAAALASFLAANPFSLLDLHAFGAELAHESARSGEAQGKLGAPRGGGLLYYGWVLTWGLGWLPALAALAGAVLVWGRERALGWMLVPAPILFMIFMGLQGRYFGRWLMPIIPILCLLAGVSAVWLARRLAGASEGRRRLLLGGLAAVLCAQGLVYSIHAGLVLSREDTRTLTRAWMVAHVPVSAGVVVEPVVPNDWVTDVGAEEPRWLKYPSLTVVVDPASGAPLAQPYRVGIEDYERTLSPALIPWYEQHGFCWVVSGSTESGRALADPGEVPQALAYYRALAADARVEFTSSPYRAGAGPVPFGFDWSFDQYPLAYERPGPVMTVYRLLGGRCAA